MKWRIVGKEGSNFLRGGFIANTVEVKGSLSIEGGEGEFR